MARLSGSKAFWLAQLRWLATLSGDFSTSRRHAVREARASGATQREVADALGISPQAVAKIEAAS